MHPGQGPGLSLHDLGETGGSETVTLLESEMPSHTHVLNGQGSNSNLNDPAGAVLGTPFRWRQSLQDAVRRGHRVDGG